MVHGTVMVCEPQVAGSQYPHSEIVGPDHPQNTPRLVTFHSSLVN